MYQLLPQLILLSAIATIIIIVLRRVPEVTTVEDDEQAVAPLTGEQQRSLWDRVRTAVRGVVAFVLRYAAEAKDRTVRAHYLERFGKVLQFRRLSGPAKSTTTVITQNELREAVQLVEGGPGGEAEQALIRIIERDPANREAYERLGKVYLDQRKFKEASEVYQYLTFHYPTEDTYFSKLGLAEFNRANYRQALTAYEQALKLRPDRSHRLINLSVCYEALGELEQAVTVARQAVAADLTNARYMMILADMLLEQGDQAAAMEAFERVLELQPTHEEAREKLMKLKF